MLKEIFNNKELQEKIIEFKNEIEGDKLYENKMGALGNLMTVDRPYDKGFSMNAHNLLCNIYMKKIDFIKEAKTKGEIKAILTSSPIRDNGYEIVENKYYIIEEELLMWSITSLTAPLNSKGNKRYLEVFKRFFGEDLYKKIAQ